MSSIHLIHKLHQHTRATIRDFASGVAQKVNFTSFFDPSHSSLRDDILLRGRVQAAVAQARDLLDEALTRSSPIADH
jgi:hypothetical protein